MVLDLAIVAEGAIPPTPPAEEGAYGLAHPGRTLGGHVFTPFETLPWPFVTTRLGTAEGGGVTSIQVEGLADMQHLGSVKQELGVEVALLPWLGVRANGAAFVVVPLDFQTAASYGADAEVGAGVGGVLRPWRDPRFGQVSVTLDYHFDEGKAVQPAAALREAESLVVMDLENLVVEVAQAGSVDAAVAVVEAEPAKVELQAPAVERVLLQNEVDHEVVLGVQAAFGRKLVGGVVDLEVGNTFLSRTVDTQGTTLVAAGAAVSLDLRAKTAIPLGVAAAARVEKRLVAAFQPTPSFELGAYYSGREDLAFGGQIQTEADFLVLDGARQTQRHTTGALRLWYFW